MCLDCGCTQGNKRALAGMEHDHGPAHGHDHGHDHAAHGHDHGHAAHGQVHEHHIHYHYHYYYGERPVPPPTEVVGTREIAVAAGVLHKNDSEAGKVRAYLNNHKIKAINVMSSPGSGKTTLLRQTLERLSGEMKIAVIVGDQRTDYDAKRLEGTGAAVMQVNTHSSCHLDASMIARELGGFIAPDLDLLVIENVGNLVCPAAFDLGEHARIALLSVCEGEDKPAKYPVLFHSADLVLLTKFDLVPHLAWNEEGCLRHLKAVNPQLKCLKLSAQNAEGMDGWFAYLRELVKK